MLDGSDNPVFGFGARILRRRCSVHPKFMNRVKVIVLLFVLFLGEDASGRQQM